MATSTIMRITYGVVPTVTSRAPAPGMRFWMTKRFRPTGGVMKPISSQTTMMMPNQTGSKPRPVMRGKRMGSRMIITDSSSSA